MIEIIKSEIQPVSRNYRNLPPYRAFTFEKGINSTGGSGIHLVTFNAQLKNDATSDKIAELIEFDTNAHHEAKQSDGFLMYYPDEISPEHTALSFCLWRSLNHAKEASLKPAHQAAVNFARTAGRDVYEDYSVRRFLLTQQIGTRALDILEYQYDDSLLPLAA